MLKQPLQPKPPHALNHHPSLRSSHDERTSSTNGNSPTTCKMMMSSMSSTSSPTSALLRLLQVDCSPTMMSSSPRRARGDEATCASTTTKRAAGTRFWHDEVHRQHCGSWRGWRSRASSPSSNHQQCEQLRSWTALGHLRPHLTNQIKLTAVTCTREVGVKNSPRLRRRP